MEGLGVKGPPDDHVCSSFLFRLCSRLGYADRTLFRQFTFVECAGLMMGRGRQPDYTSWMIHGSMQTISFLLAPPLDAGEPNRGTPEAYRFKLAAHSVGSTAMR